MQQDSVVQVGRFKFLAPSIHLFIIVFGAQLCLYLCDCLTMARQCLHQLTRQSNIRHERHSILISCR